MPNMDNTGPVGSGPTGRGIGSCPNKDNVLTQMPGMGRGFGRGVALGGGGKGGCGGGGQGGGGRGGCGGGGRNRSRGRGGRGSMRGAGRFMPLSSQDEKAFLESDIKVMEEQLTLMKNRLGEIGE